MQSVVEPAALYARRQRLSVRASRVRPGYAPLRLARTNRPRLLLFRRGEGFAGIGIARFGDFVDAKGDLASIDIDQRQDAVPDSDRIADR